MIRARADAALYAIACAACVASCASDPPLPPLVAMAPAILAGGVDVPDQPWPEYGYQATGTLAALTQAAGSADSTIWTVSVARDGSDARTYLLALPAGVEFPAKTGDPVAMLVAPAAPNVGTTALAYWHDDLLLAKDVLPPGWHATHGHRLTDDTYTTVITPPDGKLGAELTPRWQRFMLAGHAYIARGSTYIDPHPPAQKVPEYRGYEDSYTIIRER